ncbi:rod shape determining protein RodA [Anaerosolibacter carboniphilus]|uniref:Peptidoglycan glycosyltransferase RodA n=1 Tax=Anaerosolibacter carboniphilus TaxID=1417629 RepID=A0A841KM62_9FIRM|nr:rod shape-determining protein RodA [Anaerosolibacter carboniphilus]MBB6214894.1 rod shape determining protein RodA [Anaerosolibacter carboniphilus]
MIDKKLLKNIDFTLIITIIAIFCIGLIMISSATHVTQDGLTRQVKVQAVAFALGFIAILVVLLIDYNVYAGFDKGIYAISILLLLAVYIPGVGKTLGGARSWIDLGPIDFQPVEIVKIGFILSFAKYLESRQNQLNTIKDLVPIAIYGGIPILLLLKQPDLGSALVFIIIILGMTFASGLSYKVLGLGFLTGVVSLPIAYKLMAPHQRVRIDAFLNPSDMSLPGNYHVMQSKIAIGSGQAIGKGLYQGTQNNFDFLPVQETDFIFAVLGEEFGFLGGVIVVLLYFIFLYRMMKIASASKDVYGSLVVVGITSMFAFQIFENIGMTMGVMPVTGLTLPFISYGGSSLLTSMLALGIVLNVGMRRQKIKF